MAVHEAALRGFTADADAYARGRPDYPVALDGWLRDAIGLDAASTVVDLGAGTGKFIARLATTGARVVAIEPVDAMRARLREACPAIEAHAGTAEAIPLPDGSVDAVVCAQAFHWFATPGALREIHRVLKPRGCLALVWNVRDTSVPWVQRLTDLETPYEGDTPRFHSGDWRRVFPAAGFGPLDETRFEHRHVGSPDTVIVDRFLSVSFIAALPEASRAEVEVALRRLVDDEPALAGRDIVTMPYETLAFRCKRD